MRQLLYHQLHFERDFHNSRFWGPDLRSYSPVVQSRRYRVSYNGQVLIIERTWKGIFDFFLPGRQLKLRCIAKGTIDWKDDAAHLDLEVRLSDFIIFFEWVYGVFLFGLSVFMGYQDWKMGLAAFLFALINIFVWRAYSRFTLQAFLEDLKRDIDFFKV
jgi:hypothetical protein